MNIRNLLLLAVTSLLLFSCGTTGDEVTYMRNIDQIPAAALASVTSQAGDFTIKPGDMLQINVSSSNADAVRPFNKIQYMPTLGSGSGSLMTMGDRSTVFYLVDDNGNRIQFESHMYRRTYGKALVDKQIDDLTISKLLGHRGTKTVSKYRKMSSAVLAEETKDMRKEMDRILSELASKW